MIIAVVNIVGGTIIGITQNGMTAGDALHTYGILTIGDGLVSLSLIHISEPTRH